MIILNKPYVSDFLIETIKANGFDVLDNEIARKYFPKEKLTNDKSAIEKYKKHSQLFYLNSENSIDWIFENLQDENIAKLIEISKNKALFRRTLKSIYPDYYFEEVEYSNLENIDVKRLKFPLILKPSIGFLSFGVYAINNKNQWFEALKKLKVDVEKLKDIFPKDVVNMGTFIIEEMIEGDEYALDAYFDNNGEAVILNIFQHPFFDDSDVSDRAYFTSKEILNKYLDKFKKVLDEIGKCANFKNFPFHLELRANKDKIIPIEINPMRFCGWCITDIAKWAWGINVYEYYLKQLKPDWNEILKNAQDDYYYFTIGDIPSTTDKTNLKVDYDKYLKNISNPLDIRKIDYKTNPIFIIVFAKTKSLDEIKNILNLDMTKFFS